MTRPSEKDVVAAWQKWVRSGTALATEQGESVEIIYPGRRNDSQGADYQDAVITTSGRLMKGDIEVHVRSSDWWSHRHHLDPAYNRVVLHVVWWHDTEAPTSLRNGSTVPVLVLGAIRETSSERRSAVSHSSAQSTPCAGGISGAAMERLAELLDQAGNERFFAKAAEFQADLAQVGAGQVLYRGIMGALGYSRNKMACLELADRLPLTKLESVASAKTSDEQCIIELQTLLIGMAGLMPSQRGTGYFRDGLTHRYIGILERLWSSCRDGREMSPDRWHLCCTRPYNSLMRRLAAMSYLITRYREEGLLTGLWGRYVEDTPSYQDWRRMEEGLLVSADDYWGCHFDFGADSLAASPTVLGEGRASDIMINVLLPFSYVWGQSAGRPELTTAALDAYRRHPRLADNALLKHMRSQLRIGRLLVSSARRQQGLLHIYRTLCTQGQCGRCSLFISVRDEYPEPVVPEVG
ncbi:MAG TPA: DUF2851 family protein [Dehalococcoidia bacterium]|nr:DUF2851 family protein [Dehalococcoidia bacterium]